MLRERELSILFQNNHFSTLYKLGGRLYSLVTDSGLVGAAPEIVWALLQDTTGDVRYCDEQFRPYNPNQKQQPPPQRPPMYQAPPQYLQHAQHHAMPAAAYHQHQHQHYPARPVPAPRRPPPEDDDACVLM